MFGRSAAAILVIAAASLAACGSDVDNGVAGKQPSETSSLTVYVSLPGKGPDKAEADALVKGIKLALKDSGGKIDGKDIKFARLDDTGADGLWDDGQVTDNARIAIRDRTTIAYIGELDSGASALSIPILNEAGVLQVSPTSGYSGLTRSEGVVQGEPDKYYPSGKRTFGRITPGDHVEAIAQVDYQQQQGCSGLVLLHDQEVYGTGLARAIQAAAEEAKITIAGNDAFDPDAKDYTSLAKKVAKQPADCAFVGVSKPDTAVRVWRALHRENPQLKIFGPDRLVNDSFTSKIGTAGDVTYLTGPHLRRSDYPESSRPVLREYEKLYGGTAPIEALYGYATMDAVLQSIRNGGSGSGSLQSRTIKAFFELERDSVIGKYKIDKSGDSSISQYGSYTVRGGQPSFDSVIDTDD